MAQAILRLAAVCRKRPPAWNKGTQNETYKEFSRELERAYIEAGSPKFEGYLYGLVYWFVWSYKPGRHPDADNISKPIWDILGARDKNSPPHELRLAAYKDDSQIRLRLAGIYDVGLSHSGGAALESFDLSVVPLPVLSEFEAFLNEPPTRPPLRASLTYIEVGPLRRDMFAFNLAEVGISR
jgi:hypothetical protein